MITSLYTTSTRTVLARTEISSLRSAISKLWTVPSTFWCGWIERFLQLLGITVLQQGSSLIVGIRFRCSSHRRHVGGMGQRHLQRLFAPEARSAIWNPSILWDCCLAMPCDWRNLARKGYVSTRHVNEWAEEYRRDRFREPD